MRQNAGAVERPSASRSSASRASSARARAAIVRARIEAADRELRMRQHGVHLERERRVARFLGELRGALRTREVLRHVAGEPAQASVRREQERMTARIPQSLGDGACLLEEVLRLALFDAGDAADLEQRDARGELEGQGLAGLGKVREELRDPAAVPRSRRRIAPRDAPARPFVPAGGLEVLAGLLEVMGEERGVGRGRGPMDREQRAGDAGVRPAPAIQKLRAVGDLVGEGMPEGALTRKVGGTEELGRREPLERRGELGSWPDRPRRAAARVGTSRPITAAAWSTSLSRGESRSMRDARTA